MKKLEKIENVETESKKTEKGEEKGEENEKPKKISKPIVIIRDVLKKLQINPKTGSFPRQVLKRFIHLAEQVYDPRVAKKVVYPVPYLLVIMLLAVLSGAENWVEIGDFAEAKKKLLKRILPHYNGAPSHDTFRRVLGILKPEQLGQTVTEFMIENIQLIKKALRIEDEGYKLIGVDGKEGRASGRKYNTEQKAANLQSLNVYDASNAICLSTIPINSKTNEIPVAKSFLEQMQLKNTIVTFDALNTQKGTINAICTNNGDYVGGLKENQHLFYDEVVLYFDEYNLEQIRKKGVNFYTYTEKAHNRIEKRSYYLTTDIQWFADLDLWKNLKAFVCTTIETQDLITHKKTTEYHYYISSLTNIELVADAIRSHWSIENQLHWHLDATFEEDEDATMDKNAFNNFSILRKLALSICKLVQPIQPKKVGLRIIRKSFGWNLEDQLKRMLSIFDVNVLQEAMLNCMQKSKKTKRQINPI